MSAVESPVRVFLPRALAAAFVASGLLAGCGSSDSSESPGSPSEDAGVADALDAGADAARDQTVDAPEPDGSVPDSSEPDAEPDAPSADGPLTDGPPVDGGYPEPTPDDIQYGAIAPLPAGEQLLFNDWTASPNELLSIKPDGTGVTKVFRTFRIWSFGVSRDAMRIAFSCGDPEQEKNYGLTLGDAIQHTWIYDVQDQTIDVQAFGNINDECHTFGPADAWLYVCRRYDFTTTNEFKGWRIGRIDLATKAFEFLTPDLANTFDLYPQPLPDETSMLFGRIVWVPPNPQEHSVMQLQLPSGTAAPVRTDGGRPALSPDATRYLFQKATDGNALYSSKLDGSDEVKVTAARATDPVWSPDGTRVAYLVWDDGVGCSHIDVVASDGTQAGSPTRVRDCSQTNEFISQLAWTVRP